MQKPGFVCVIWTAILCMEGFPAGFAHAQYSPADAYGDYPAAGSTPGFRQAVPGPPQAPAPAARPGTWPGSKPGSEGTHTGSAPGYVPQGAEGRHSASHHNPHVARLSDPPTAMGAPHDPARRPGTAHVRPFIGAHVVARVGREVITVSDLLALVPSVIDRNRGKLPDDMLEAQQEALTRDLTRAIEEAFARQKAPPDQLMLQSEQLRAQMLDQMIKGQIQTLLVFLDAQRNIPEEGLPEIRQQVDSGFEKQVVPALIKQAEAGSRQELEEFLRSRGSSLDREKRIFFQQTVAQQWMRQHVNPNEEITHEQMLDYYRSHPDEFDRPAQIVWEQLAVQFVDQPSHQEAHAAIAGMGNRVLAGEPFAEVAKGSSQGPTASEGGRRVWPEERLLSEELERAIHGLPVGQLSPILRDWRGLHIVRVLERTPAGRLPFEKAQEEIRQKIREERIQKQIDAYVDELTRRTSVWTVLDPPPSDHVASPAVQRR